MRIYKRYNAAMTAGLVVLCLAFTVACATATRNDLSPIRHPLDPLTESEIAAASRIITAHHEFPKGALFPILALKEPDKAIVENFKSGDPIRREAFATVLDRAANKTFEAIVDLNSGKVKSWQAKPGAQPLVLVEEYNTVPKIVKADHRWQEAMKKRGITDFERVWVDTWATGTFVPKDKRQTRVLRAVSYLKDGAINFYGRPIEGVVALVDMNHEKVINLIDTGVVPVAKVSRELDPQSLGKQRTDLKPLDYSTPQGPSYEITGNEIRWQKWRFRFALHPREGLVLYRVGYDDAGKTRSILYRASLSETVVPYGDPDSNWSWRNAFDEGEYGMGRLASTLEPNIDGPATTKYFDVFFSDDFGKPYVVKNAVGLYEKDDGYLWKHFDIYTGKNQARRARELVLYTVSAVGNYDYIFSWIFHQDGSLDLDVGLSGIMLPKGVTAETIDELAHGHSHLVAKNVAAPHHQHFLNFRLDFDVDGEKNSIVEMNTAAMAPGPKNLDHNAIMMNETLLKTEIAARRDLNMKSARKWKIFNPEVKNALGYPTGYVLLPGENSIPYIGADTLVRKRGSFINHHFWATKFKDDEIYAAGFYPNQAQPGDGLEKWTSNNDSLTNTDVVVWYTFGITHVPRPEEWPVMPTYHAGFKLVPAGFFNESPALDVPPQQGSKP